MKLHLALSFCIFGSQVWLVQTQQSQAYADFLNKISSFVTSVTNVISGPTELKTLRDVPGCGKRNTREESKKSTLAECLWDCEWEDQPTTGFEKLYRTFVRTPVRWNGVKVDEKAEYDDPTQVFPNSYVEYIKIQYGEEENPKNFYVDQFMSLPRHPKDTRCLKDCIFPLNIRETRIRVCVQATKEWFQNDLWKSVESKFIDLTNPNYDSAPLISFYECMIALNVETLSDEFEEKEIRRSGKSFSRDYEMLTVELCFLAERDWWLHYVSDRMWTEFAMDDLTITTPDVRLRQGCDEIFRVLLSAISGEAVEDIFKTKKRDFQNNTKSLLQNYRDYVELAKEDIILRADNKRDDNRLTGASVFPTDLDLAQNSQHHPWACSLRTRGYRGRHRCGVTLLYGPRKDKKETHDDPYVLVSAAHCNYICKDRIRGDVLETCCCRPPNEEGSCAPNSAESPSPFCTGQPVFTLAEPEDVVIICGEFNSGVEILKESWEPEQVFTVTKIIQHPNYKPTTADIGSGSGGPIDGNDIAVYHVNNHGFLLGENVKVRVTNNLADEEIDRSSENYIWPVCLPKDDNDEGIEDEDDHPLGRPNTVNAMLAGWLDAPPISQAFSNLLGSSLKEADVLKLYYYPRVMGLEEQKQCIDPEYQMKENKEITSISDSTFYPKGTICFKDPSANSCPEFGSSGSGIVRSWKKRQDKKILSIDGACNPFGTTCNVNIPSNSPIDQTEAPIDAYQYSFVGPLSMQKGCDNAFHMYTRKVVSVQSVPKNNGIDYETNKLSYRGENPLVATDARCFMPWIASQYNMKLDKEYDERTNCQEDNGNRDNKNQEICLANFLGRAKKCDFTLCEDINEEECTDEKRWNKCKVLSKEGIAFNVNECLIKLSDQEIKDLDLPTQAHYRATCFNNCKGVNPNAITAAGVALVAVSAISSTAGLGPGAIGVGGAVLAGREVMNSMNRCGEGCCRMNNRCCRLVPRRGMMVCPRRARGCKACTS